MLKRRKYNRKTVKSVTAPAQLAVSVADMKTYLRVDTSDDDALIEDFIESATETIKEYLQRALITETFLLTMDGFNWSDDDYGLSLGAGVHTASVPYQYGWGDEIDLPYRPIQSITSLKTFNRDNTESTFSASNYELDEEGGRLYLNEGATFPTELRDREAVNVTYVAGYGDNGSDIPKPITQAIKTYVSKMYDCREVCDMPKACTMGLAPYKLINLGYF